MNYQIKYILCLCFIWHSQVKASCVFDYNCRKAYAAVTALSFAESANYLHLEKLQNPSNQAIILIENYRDCLEIILSEDKALYSQKEKQQDIRLGALKKETNTSPYYLYAEAEINLQWAFAHIKLGEYLTGVLAINKAYKALEKNKKKFPEFIPQYKSLGLLHALIGVVPDEYKWAINLLGFSGTLAQGIGELEMVYHKAENDTNFAFLKTETTLMLTIVQLNFGSDEKKLIGLLNEIEKTSIINPILSFSYVDICMHLGKNDEAILFQKLHPFSSKYYPFHYLNYLNGLCKLYKQDNDAIVYLNKYVTDFKGNSFIKSAYLKGAYYYWIKGDKQNYSAYMVKIKEHGDEVTDEDKAAQKEATQGLTPNLYLLLSRLQFDGGYYSKAFSTLVKAHKDDFKTTKEQLEFVYRLARIQHKKENYTKAIYYYQITAKNGARLPFYYAANATLNLGLVYEEMEQYDMAKTAFTNCLKIKNHEYQRSIDQKAKAGLNRLSGKK